MTNEITPCRTPPEFKEDIDNGYVLALLSNGEYHMMTVADYEKLALNMLQLVDHYRGNMLKRIKAADREIYKQCRKGNQ